MHNLPDGRQTLRFEEKWLILSPVMEMELQVQFAETEIKRSLEQLNVAGNRLF